LGYCSFTFNVIGVVIFWSEFMYDYIFDITCIFILLNILSI